MQRGRRPVCERSAELWMKLRKERVNVWEMFRFNNWIRLNYTLNGEQLAKLEYTELFITKRINVKFLESFPAWFATLYSAVRSFLVCRDRYKLQRTTDIKISNGTNENRGIESILTSIRSWVNYACSVAIPGMQCRFALKTAGLTKSRTMIIHRRREEQSS